MQNIKNLIFDFGNVLFDLDLPAMRRNFEMLLGKEAAVKAREKLQRDGVFVTYEVGGMSSDEFIEAVRLASDPPLSEAQMLQAWNSIFLSMPAERFDMLLQLRQRYKVFLLSNINALHEQYVADYMLAAHNIHDFEARYFDAVYYSHLVRMRKPNADIYEYVLADAEIDPAESLFFDDLPENIEAAEKLGIIGRLKPEEERIEDALKGMGLIL